MRQHKSKTMFYLIVDGKRIVKAERVSDIHKVAANVTFKYTIEEVPNG